MFSLIITIVSIALVAALALATLFYGGGAFRQGTAEAQATKVVNQGQQLLAASELYYAEKGQWPQTTADLVSQGYLKTVPVAQLPLNQAMAAAGQWTMPLAGEPVFMIDASDPETCRTVNSKGYGQPGILNTVHENTTIQCFGKTLSDLTVIVSRNSLHLGAVAQAGTAGFTSSDILSGAVPADGQTSAWLVRPSSGPVAGSSTGGTGGTGEPGAGAGGDTGGAGGDTGGTGGDTGGTGEGSTEPPPPAEPPRVTLGGQDGGNFNSVILGQSKTLNFTYSNSGQGPATGVQVSIQGNPAFTVQGNNCGSELAAGASCTITVKFTPTENTFYHAENTNLVVTSNDVNSPHAVALSGYGARGAELQLSSTSLNLATVPTVSPTQRLTLTNQGQIGNLTLTDLTLGGSYVSFFAKTNGCTAGTVLTPGDYCYVDVTFNPGVGAGFNAPGTLTVGDSVSGTTRSVTLAADSRYTPAAPFGVAGGAGATVSGNTVNWTAATQNVGFNAGATYRDKGKFTLAFTGNATSMNELEYNVALEGTGYYGLSFLNSVVVRGNTGVATGSGNGTSFTRPTLANGDRVLMQIDYDSKTVRWYHCGPTLCDKPNQPFHTMTASTKMSPYVWKAGKNNPVSITLLSSNLAGIPNSTTFHNGLPQ